MSQPPASPPPGAQPGGFDAGRWRILEIRGEILQGPVTEAAILQIVSAENLVSATVGCNQIGASFEITDSSVVFSKGISTLMGCPPELDRLEQRLGQILTGARTWRVNGVTLQLLDGETVLATFLRLPD